MKKHKQSYKSFYTKSNTAKMCYFNAMYFWPKSLLRYGFFWCFFGDNTDGHIQLKLRRL